MSDTLRNANVEFCMINDLADEILLKILGYLSTRDRWSLSKTCQRFRNLYSEKILWSRIDVPFEIENHQTLRYILTSCINSRTTFLRIVGTCHGSQRGCRSSLTPSLLLNGINSRKCRRPSELIIEPDSDDGPTRSKRRKVQPSCNYEEIMDKCTDLKEFHLIRQKIDGRYLYLRDLPTSLRVLNLTGTNVSGLTEESGYFRDISFYLVNLEDLDMTDCTWITSHALLALSKLPSLLRISLRGCRSIGNCIAYVSLSMRLGFRKLKILDVTNTRFRGPDIDCASYLPCLEEFYVGEYDQFDTSIDYYSLSMDINFGYFRQSQTLKVIDISGCVVTDNIFETFLTLPNISKITAHFTDLSELAIEEFKKLRPSCLVEKEDELCELGF